MLQKKLCLSRVRILGRKSIPNKALRQTYQLFCIYSKRPPHTSKKSSNFVLIQNAPLMLQIRLCVLVQFALEYLMF